MRVRYTSASGRVEFEFECTTGKQAFEWVAAIQELFEEPCCGACESKHIRCDVRTFDGNSYYKLVCIDCGAQLDYGQNRDGQKLFVKRKDKDGRAVGKNGWYHYEGRGG